MNFSKSNNQAVQTFTFITNSSTITKISGFTVPNQLSKLHFTDMNRDLHSETVPSGTGRITLYPLDKFQGNVKGYLLDFETQK